MNIGIICYPTYGGSGVMATELGIALGSKGHKVHFITYKRPARLSSFHENVFFHEVSAMDYPLFEFSPYESALASKIVDVAKYEKLDVLHVHYAIPHASVACMAQEILSGKEIYLPIITTLHGTDITVVGHDSSYKPVAEYAINRSNVVTAVSNYLKKATYKEFDVNRDIEVIPNFIDMNRFHKFDKEHFKKVIAPQKEFVITHMSNFRKVKRVKDVIKVFARINKKFSSLLLLIGDGPERQNIECLTRELGIEKNVRFLGKQDAVEELLSISDLFLLPSASESFGLAALEAMACEVPVISTNIGGLPEVNEDGITGFTEDVGDIGAMAEKAIKILGNQELHHSMKKAAFEKAKTFNMNAVLPIYLELYKEVVQNVRV